MIKINIFNDSEIIKMDVNGEINTFDFEALDKLIEKIVDNCDEIEVSSEQGLEYYKNLINELVNEIKGNDFQKALQEVRSNVF